MYFPIYRPRRLRANPTIRRMVRETRLSVDNFIYPLFVCPGEGVKKEISSMPGNYQFSIDMLLKEMEEVESLGIPGVILFGIPEHKDELGSEAYDDQGIIQRAIRAIKSTASQVQVITDVCLCEYTSHGHCGIIQGEKILNDPTLELLAREAVSHARAGADMVAPSDMMDGRIGVVREALDHEGFEETPIMAYSVKYASAFYGPFRDAAESPPQFGDRQSYQMDAANVREAIREADQDIQEGADLIMVKPALPYLDIIRLMREEFDYPLAAYNVSGEYAMIKAADQLGWIDGPRVMMETLLSIKRAGADLILTYFAKEAAQLL
ncbi:MAG: porphobilinogen synthase [Deltaproteobacteria bacterium]|nr:porphobilinogen synthase [Candidatus Tharpellaceae bacterium]RLB63144.1 MAG: porphobilinogen synthase [Deltaproteobacteria bacterium]HDJ29400.1 porphobilinogen synthase [Pseudomonadota bacterium]